MNINKRLTIKTIVKQTSVQDEPARKSPSRPDLREELKAKTPPRRDLREKLPVMVTQEDFQQNASRMKAEGD